MKYVRAVTVFQSCRAPLYHDFWVTRSRAITNDSDLRYYVKPDEDSVNLALPCLEVLYLWNAFPQMDGATLGSCLAQVDAWLESRSDDEQQVFFFFACAPLARRAGRAGAPSAARHSRLSSSSPRID